MRFERETPPTEVLIVWRRTAIYSTPFGNFSPRIGFGWQLELLGSGSTSSTVTAPQPGFSQTTQHIATNNTFLTPANTLSNPSRAGSCIAGGKSAGASTFLGQAITFYTPNPRNPYSLRWDPSIQRQLPGSMVLEVE